MHGVPVFRGTRVPVQTLFDYLEGGDTLEDFLAGFPTVPRALALEALKEAKQLLPWMSHFGELRDLHNETACIDRIIETEFEQIDIEDWK